MVGTSVFGYFFAGRVVAFEKSDSPGWAKQKPSANHDNQPVQQLKPQSLGLRSAQPNLRRPTLHPLPPPQDGAGADE